MAVKKVKAYLVYRGSDRSMRVVHRTPNLSWDEIAWVLALSVPASWGGIAGQIDIEMPEAPLPPPEVTMYEPPAQDPEET